ncbi:hypothetical protein BD414DRAFT_448726 [Trametes punicea]|nr:hypothetical protein BD414DRAFT_448726 [Trametes punicea]
MLLKLPSQTSDVPSHSRAPSLPLPAPSRATTPDFISVQDSLSSPLSSPPRSLADEHDVAVDIDVGADIDIKDLPPPVSAPILGPRASGSRAPSVAGSETEQNGVREPYCKKARCEDDADSRPPDPASSLEELCVPTFTKGRESQARDAEADQGQAAQRQKPSQKRRRRVVWSDDESDSDADIRAPASAPAPSQRRRAQEGARKRRREKDQEREREKAKKPRAKGPGTDAENEPLETPATQCAVSLSAKPVATLNAAARPAAPASATNLALPGTAPHPHLQSEPLDRDRVPAKPPHEPQLEAHELPQPVNESQPSSGDKPSKRDQAIHGETKGPDLPAYILPLPAGELEGMLIETLATTRASSLATTDLYGALMAARPALREMALPAAVGATATEQLTEEKAKEKPEGEKKPKGGGRGRGAKTDADVISRRAWVPALEGVLEAGWRRSGVFGKVVNCGTDTGDQELTLEARWFYDPDRDEDQERATLVRSMMRRPPKRSETKKAKQYYWRPLPKISRWDPEDEL